MATREELHDEAELLLIKQDEILGLPDNLGEDYEDEAEYGLDEDDNGHIDREVEQQINKSENLNTNHTGSASQRLYQSPLCQPVISVGATTVGMSQARLYGMLDKNGKVKLKDDSPKLKGIPAKIDSLAQPREDAIFEFEESEEDIKFRLDRQNALKAMRNPRCGYDFIDRINDRGSFLDRACTSDSKKGNKKKNEGAKQDYDALLDKLCCPVCKKPQTFEEFAEKKRICTLCNKKFTKLNVTNTGSFERKLKQQEKAKQEKLAKLDAQFYPKIETKILGNNRTAPTIVSKGHFADNSQEAGKVLTNMIQKQAETNRNVAELARTVNNSVDKRPPTHKPKSMGNATEKFKMLVS